MSDFLVIQGCPAHARVAGYIEAIRHEIGGTVNSIYRGQDAAAILHRHGKHTQAEIHREYPGISNPPGRSTHELRSDGVAYAGPVGRKLDWWGEGWDTNDSEVGAWINCAHRHGWSLFRPYSRGVEYHHLNFAHPPRPHSLKDFRAVVAARKRLPNR